MILCFAVCCFTLKSQDSKLIGRLLSADKNEPVPYAIILNIDRKGIGTTSNKEGRFILNKGFESGSDKLFISSLGFKDITISIDQLRKLNGLIKLEPEFIDLPQITVTLKGEMRSYGSKTEELRDSEKWAEASSMRFRSAGIGYGVFINPKPKDKGQITSMQVHVASLSSKSTLAIRMLKPNVKMQNGKLLSITEFKDLLPEVVLFEPDKVGWNEIDLENYGMPVPKEKFLIIVYPLDKPESDLQMSYPTLSIYESHKVSQLLGARQINGNEFTFLKPFGNNKFRIPAVILNWYKF